jgi:phage portal protein BeeE
VASILDRLFGVPAQPVAPPAVKAVTGPGVVAYDIGVPLTSMSRTPQKMAREAQSLYHTNLHVYDAESTVSQQAANVEFHFEDDAGNRIEDTHPALVPIYKPSPQKGVGKKRKPLWHLTFRHGGMCGYAFWYADALGGDGIPQGFYYINPARMWDAKDAAGNLVGWVMDADRPDGRQPVAFSVEEIFQFVYDPADDGHLGVGIVESAWRTSHVSAAADRHAEKSVSSGGRKPGIIMPTEGRSFNEDEYQAIVRELRNVTDSPDAVKKSLIFKSPVDYKDAGVTSSQLQLVDLMRMSRENILAHWKVPPSQIGITQSRGLNSGETQKYEEAALWQNAIQPRLDMLQQTLQDDYLDQFGIHLVLHTPTFDDQQPLYDLAAKSQNIAMTNDERRALVGLGPLGPQNGGSLVYLPSTLALVGTGPDNADEEVQTGGEVKARLTFTSIRDKVEAAHLPALNRRIAEVLAEQKTEIADRVTRSYQHLLGKPTDDQKWWNEEREYRRLQAALAPVVEQIANEVQSKTSATFFREPAKASLLERVLEFVRHRSGIRIKGINDTTRQAVREVVEQGVAQGLSPAELADNIKGLGTFDASRAELIARTETGYALNDGALSTYREFGASRVHVYDGDKDEACANANGSVWTLEEAESDPLGHPNCTRDFAPIVV